MRTPILRWLSLRIRVLLLVVFVGGTLLPPYIPTNALSPEPEVAQQQFLFVEEGFLMKASSIGKQGSRLAFSDVLVHKVEPGEVLDAIAKQYGISSQTIRWANGMEAATPLRAGQELIVLPVDGVLHTVRRGQTLGRIAQLYDINQDAIARQNKIQGGFIVAGEQLIVPGGKPIVESAAIASVDQSLRFADRLPDRDLQLRPNVPQVPGGPSRAPAVSAVLTQTVLQFPCGNCAYTQKYHPGHYAVDIQTKGGGPIFAAEAGTVIRADTGYNGGYGNVIEVDHGNGLVTLYAHNRELYVEEGDEVKRGAVIAMMGNTGRVHGPTGIHVHFEVRVNGVKKNPLLYLE